MAPTSASTGRHGAGRQACRWEVAATSTTWAPTKTQDEAALARGRYLAEKARKERQAVLDQERSLRAFMRPEIIGDPAYSDWLQDEVDEHAPKVPCPFEYGVDYDVDPVTLQVTRVEDGKLIVLSGGAVASANIE
jgi:hypothetical protein